MFNAEFIVHGSDNELNEGHSIDAAAFLHPSKKRFAAMNPTATIQVTECRVYPSPVEDERLKAFATITLNGCFVVNDCKMINGNSGLFVAMPARRRNNGEFHKVAHPINQELRDRIEQAVLDAYWQQVPDSRVLMPSRGCARVRRRGRIPKPTRRSSHEHCHQAHARVGESPFVSSAAN